jgi:hypothetical protein
MAVDTRLKRQSATCMLVPSLSSGVYPDTSGIVAAERAAATWLYSGIVLSEPVFPDIIFTLSGAPL